MFSCFSLISLSMIASRWTQGSTAIAMLAGVEEILAFMGPLHPGPILSTLNDEDADGKGDGDTGVSDTRASDTRASDTKACVMDHVIGVNGVDGNNRCSLKVGLITLKGDRSSYGNLPHYGLPNQLQHWLSSIMSDTIQGSNFRSIADAYFETFKVSMSMIAVFKLAASDICEPSKYPSDSGFELNFGTDANVRQPTSGRYRSDSIPA